MNHGSVYSDVGHVSQPGAEEFLQQLAGGPHVRIERIISKGHVTPECTWYDQPQHEWVMVVQGRGKVLFEKDGSELELGPGDWCEIPAHCRHRVSWTDPDQETVWLAVHYQHESGQEFGG